MNWLRQSAATSSSSVAKTEMEGAYHIPVMLHESVEGLQIDPDGIYVDATFGGGGHSLEILNRLKSGRLLGFDQDPDARANAPEDPRFTFIAANFRHAQRYLRAAGVRQVDGILADLGVSSHHSGAFFCVSIALHTASVTDARGVKGAPTQSKRKCHYSYQRPQLPSHESSGTH